MREYIKERWIDALTNGSYIQTHIGLRDQASGILRNVDNEGYTIFGVLLDLFVDYRFDLHNPIFWYYNKVRLPEKYKLVADYLREVAHLTMDEQLAVISLYDIPRRSFAEAAEFIANDFTSDPILFKSPCSFPDCSHALR